jgi:hypothetical protein
MSVPDTRFLDFAQKSHFATEPVSDLTCKADLDPASAHWVALQALGEPDANPFGAASPLIPTMPPWIDAAAHETLRPWRSYAAVLLAVP